jgi:hypothetical protein
MIEKELPLAFGTGKELPLAFGTGKELPLAFQAGCHVLITRVVS